MDAAVNNFVAGKVAQVLGATTHVEASTISASTRLADDLALSRFGRLKLAILLEDLFDLELPDDDLAGFATVADIVRYISRRYFRNVEPSYAAAAV